MKKAIGNKMIPPGCGLEFKRLLDERQCPDVGIHLDVGSIRDTGFPEQWIDMHCPRITCANVRDTFRERGYLRGEDSGDEPLSRR